MRELLDDRIADSRNALASAIESRNTATKSSAGDKHETGRAMMQTEIDNLENQLAKMMLLKNNLDQVPKEEKAIGDFGSLIETDKGIYFVSVSLGKIVLDSKEIFTISPASPLGQAFKNIKEGETVNFQNRSYQLISIQ